MKFSKNSILALIFLATLQGVSQEILTKKEALKITLENNFGVKIANNNLEIANNNKSIFNSRFLPTVSASTSANYRNDNQTITRQDGTSTSISDAVTKSYNASLNLNYIIFDGLGRKYNYQQLKETYNLSELQAKFPNEEDFQRELELSLSAFDERFEDFADKIKDSSDQRAKKAIEIIEDNR